MWKIQPKEKFIMIQAYFRKQTNKKSHINNLALDLKELEKRTKNVKS